MRQHKQVKSDKPDTLIIQIPFSGFYESTHDAIIKDEIESMFRDDSGNDGAIPDEFWFKYNSCWIEKRYAERYVMAFKAWLKDTVELDLQSLAFEKMTSPKEYNFETDKIFAYISKEDVLKLKEHANALTLAQVIKDRHTSRSGFISFYSNDVSEWLSKDVLEYDHNELETLLIAAISTVLNEGREEWEQQLDGFTLMENDMCNGVIHNIICDELPDECMAIINEHDAKRKQA